MFLVKLLFGLLKKYISHISTLDRKGRFNNLYIGYSVGWRIAFCILATKLGIIFSFFVSFSDQMIRFNQQLKSCLDLL